MRWPGLRILSLMVSVLSLLGFAFADGKPLIALLAVLVGAWSHSLVSGAKPRALPRWLLNTLVGVSTLYLVTALLGTREEVISSLTNFLSLVLLLKMLDRVHARDEAQMLSLTVFVMIGAVLTGAQLSLGAVLIVYTPLMIAAAVVWQIAAGQEQMFTRRQAVLGAGAPVTPVPAGLYRQLGFVIGLALALSLTVGVAAFVFTPRNVFQGLGGGWGRPGSGAVTAYRDQIKLGDAGLISQSSTPVMDVVLSDKAGTQWTAIGGPLYLRGATLDRYDPASGRWSRSREDDSTIPTTPIDVAANDRRPFGPDSTLETARAPITQIITLRNVTDQNAPLFAALRPVGLELASAAKIRVRPADGTLKRSGPAGSMTYTVISDPDFVNRHDADDTTEPGAMIASVPIRELAASLLAQAKIPLSPVDRDAVETRRAAQVIRAYLQSSAFSYTLEMIAPRPGQDPLEMFLFDTRRGHCEYFAAAMVALCQSVGVQSRIVTGYVCAEYNSIAGHYVVRESDAHAWVEVRARSGRWETFDPTPAGELQSSLRAGDGWLSRLRQLYDALELTWAQNVISYDAAAQNQLIGGSPRLGDPDLLRSLRGWVEPIGNLLRMAVPVGALDAQTGLVLVLGVGICLVVAGVPLTRMLIRRFDRRASPTIDYTQASADVARRARFYPDALKVLQRAGVGKPLATPPLAHADALAGRDPQSAELLRRLGHAYYAVRFGGQPPTTDTAADLAALKQAVEALKPVR